jgi:hypothetical protein
MTIAWYSIVIYEHPGLQLIFQGIFSLDTTTNIINAFYNVNDTTFSNNILITTPQTGIDTNKTSNNLYVNNDFPPGGTTITSIPYLDSTYNATMWALWDHNDNPQKARLSYLSNGSWTTLPNNYLEPFDVTSIPDPSCFNEGTKILCLNKHFEEEYIPIENLRKGHLVKSFKHGYRKIDLIGKNPMINNPEIFNACMYKMQKTDQNGLIEDLIVTGGHAILVDDLSEHKEENDKIFGTTHMIDDKYLLLCAVSKDFKKLDHINLYTYYHFTLENNGNDDERYGVWANGILTETPSKKQFTNHKYTLL